MVRSRGQEQVLPQNSRPTGRGFSTAPLGRLLVALSRKPPSSSFQRACDKCRAVFSGSLQILLRISAFRKQRQASLELSSKKTQNKPRIKSCQSPLDVQLLLQLPACQGAFLHRSRWQNSRDLSLTRRSPRLVLSARSLPARLPRGLSISRLVIAKSAAEFRHRSVGWK